MSHTSTLYRSAAMALVLASAAGAQVVRTTATPVAEFKGEKADNVLPSPNEKLIAYTAGDQIRIFDTAKRISTTVGKGTDIDLLRWSPAGDAFAFIRDRDSDYAGFIWTQGVDPATGDAKGPAQRVSMTRAEDSGIYSPDGKSIAFVSGESTPSLLVVPATGGKERLVANLPSHADAVSWSSDGKTIFLGVLERIPGQPAGYQLEAVSAAGGKPNRIMPLRGCYLFGPVAYGVDFKCSGASADTLLRLFDLSGHELGTFSLPSGLKLAELASSRGAVFATHIEAPVTLRIADVAGGPGREIAKLGPNDRMPAWSKDGQKIALQTERAGRFLVTLMNADGSDRRDVPVTGLLDESLMRWSPDGQWIVLRMEGGSTLAVLDVRSGGIKTLNAPSDSFVVANYRWTADSRAVRYVRFKKPWTNGGTTELREATLNGDDRRLRDVSAYSRTMRYWLFPSDTTFALLTKDTLFIVPTTGGPVRRFAGEVKNRWTPSVSHDGETIVSAYAPPGGTYLYTSLELTSVRDGSRRVIPLPFEASTAMNTVPMFLPDGKHLVVASVASSGNPKRLWIVSTEGEPPRAFDILSESSMPTTMNLSPDGRSVIFTRPGTPTTTLFKADFSSLLKR